MQRRVQSSEKQWSADLVGDFSDYIDPGRLLVTGRFNHEESHARRNEQIAEGLLRQKGQPPRLHPQSNVAAGAFVAAETLLERFALDQAYGGEVDPKDPAIRVGSYRVSRQNPPN